MGDRLVKIQNKKTPSKAQINWKTARSDERWERRADRQMLLFSAVSVLLPSQITHLRQGPAESRKNDISEDAAY
jgi:hypothetical protein